MKEAFERYTAGNLFSYHFCYVVHFDEGDKNPKMMWGTSRNKSAIIMLVAVNEINSDWFCHNEKVLFRSKLIFDITTHNKTFWIKKFISN